MGGSLTLSDGAGGGTRFKLSLRHSHGGLAQAAPEPEPTVGQRS